MYKSTFDEPCMISETTDTGDETIKTDHTQDIKDVKSELAEESPFTCHHCGVVCSHKGNLKRHILTKHTNLSKEEKRRLHGQTRKDGKEKTRKKYGPDYEKLKNASDVKSGVCHLCGEVDTYYCHFYSKIGVGITYSKSMDFWLQKDTDQGIHWVIKVLRFEKNH